ncbi:hypothetical protein HPB49_006773 [Dermacentor silvarum]|uniref:Uncharacterized protein n=1 Tax=Dermacentor silvarum TaxID=543639 RepID=A0ACB8D392_DERSI|nr:hypothetical protein HPB49_006773 [Dermacentor silvarum]
MNVHLRSDLQVHLEKHTPGPPHLVPLPLGSGFLINFFLCSCQVLEGLELLRARCLSRCTDPVLSWLFSAGRSKNLRREAHGKCTAVAFHRKVPTLVRARPHRFLRQRASPSPGAVPFLLLDPSPTGSALRANPFPKMMTLPRLRLCSQWHEKAYCRTTLSEGKLAELYAVCSSQLRAVRKSTTKGLLHSCLVLAESTLAPCRAAA